jgi:DNA mismatch endonuclease (patch repair protein)
MDIMSKEERSQRMRRVRSTGTRSTEGKFRLALVRRGIKGWRMHDRELPGCPDFVFAKRQLAVFVDGCFWHGCPVCKRPLPEANKAYWAAKIRFNSSRSRQIARQLRSSGYQVVRVWEHTLRSPQALTRFLNSLFPSSAQK